MLYADKLFKPDIDRMPVLLGRLLVKINSKGLTSVTLTSVRSTVRGDPMGPPICRSCFIFNYPGRNVVRHR